MHGCLFNSIKKNRTKAEIVLPIQSKNPYFGPKGAEDVFACSLGTPRGLITLKPVRHIPGRKAKMASLTSAIPVLSSAVSAVIGKRALEVSKQASNVRRQGAFLLGGKRGPRPPFGD